VTHQGDSRTSNATLIQIGDSATHHQDQVITPVSLSTKGVTRVSDPSQFSTTFQYRSAVDWGGLNWMKNTDPA
jgi:hypothetical protein